MFGFIGNVLKTAVDVVKLPVNITKDVIVPDETKSRTQDNVEEIAEDIFDLLPD